MRGSPSCNRKGSSPLGSQSHKNGVFEMTASVPAPKSRVLTARRLMLLAGAAGLGAAVLLGGTALIPKSATTALAPVAYAQGVQRPVGFADIVEKVKPAVISVR